MAKIQNTFTQGKMNKDLDERLLPVGQYRHAMNVQVNTSEGSDVGTIQNILGTNNNLPKIGSGGDGVCVGSIADEKNNHVYWFTKLQSTGDNIISRYNTDTDSHELVLVDKNNILEFTYENIITGINIVDDMLFFTDNISEPKKINITRCIEGTTDINTHTKLFVNGEVVQDIVPATFGTPGSATDVDLRKEHITVIKKAPKYPPVLKMSSELPTGVFSGSTERDFDTYGVNDTLLINVALPANVDPNSSFNIQQGDIIVLQNYTTNVPDVPLAEYVIRAEVLQIVSGTNPPSLNNGLTLFSIKILSKSVDTPSGLETYYMSLLIDKKNKFEFKFPRFAYRYRYEDGEYSSFSPFSEIAFLPGGFDYHPRKGYNIGMTNKLTDIYVTEFVTEDQPEDVVEIDLLYKESDSSSVYVVETLKPDNDEYKVTNFDANNGILNLKRNGSYLIKSETIYSLLPSNQILRPYDNVPRFAKAQEVVANRLIYGNYVQNYDLSPRSENADYKTKLSVVLQSENVNSSFGVKSLKSLRDYQVGVVYLDEYGRQTPVLTTNTSTITVDKANADKSNKLRVQVSGGQQAPSWAKGFKFYVKETTGEYYNLAMDRFYNAEDGNIWLAFPSVDRNKVDIETFLILKKGSESDDLVTAEAKYKIIAISNEAPDFIKEKFFPLGSVVENSSNHLFGSVSSLIGSRSVNILEDPNGGFALKNGSLSHIHEKVKSKRVRIRFEGGSNNQVSNYYEVTTIGYEPGSSDYPVGEIKINIEENFGADVNFIFSGGTISSGVRLVFEEIKVVNSPKFDGRFFVKIYNDASVQQNIGVNQSTSSKYQVLTSRKLYYLSPNHIALHSLGGTGAVNDPTYDPNVYTFNDDYHDNGIIIPSNINGNDWFRGIYSNSIPDFWYKYTAFFRNQHTFDINDRSSSADASSFEDVWYIDGGLSTGTFSNSNPINSTGTNHTNVSVNYSSHQGMGVTNYSNSSIIEIGFGGMQPDPDKENQANSYASSQYVQTLVPPNVQAAGNLSTQGLTTGGSSIYAIGVEAKNEYYGLEQKEFVDPVMTVGTQFRWKEDPNGTVYTIVGNNNPDWFLLRYNNGILNMGPPFASRTGLRPENWNRNFRITLDKPMLWNPITDGALNGYSPNSIQALTSNGNLPSGVTSATFVTMEIVKQVEEEVPLASNPAIWETEPKEKAELDIYYEASNVYPVTLDEKSFSSIIKIGSVISQDQSGTIITSIVSGHDGDDIINISSASATFIAGVATITYNNTSLNITIVSMPQPGKVKISRNIHSSPIELEWFNCYSFGNGVESNRIEDNFNKAFIDNGAIASATLSDTSLIKEERRKYGLIFSGLYNTISNINNLNQFIQAENITKEINPTYGSIQKLFTRQTDLVTLCEDRIVKVLADKTALFTADGENNVTSTSNVLGQTVPFVGSYGISQNPESFASESYRAYFTDKQRGAVLRLSMDGLTPISDAGMRDWFGDNLKSAKYLIGSYDQDKSDYNITIFNDALVRTVGLSREIDYTLSFDEEVRGWTSFKSFIPESGVSCSNKYYTFYKGDIFEHHAENSQRNNFYGDFEQTLVSFIFNQEPSVVKEFRALVYEGSQSRILSVYANNTYTDANGNLLTSSNDNYKNLIAKDGWYAQKLETDLEKGMIPYFIEREKKWFNYIRGNEIDYSQGKLVVDTSKFSVQGIGFANDIQSTVAPPPPPPPPPVTVTGCTDPLADNYDPNATVDDGSCIYIAQPPGPSGPPTPIPPCSHTFSSTMVVITYDSNTEKLSYTFTIDAPTGGVVDANGNQNYRYEALYMIDGFGSQTVKSLVNATNTLNNTPGMVDGTYVGSLTIQDEQVITNDYVGYLPMPAGNRLVFITVRVYDENHPTNDPLYIQANPSVSSCFVIQAMQFPITATVPTPPLIPGSLSLTQNTVNSPLYPHNGTDTYVFIAFPVLVSGGVPFAPPNAPYNYPGNNLEYATIDSNGVVGAYTPVTNLSNNLWGLVSTSFQTGTSTVGFTYSWSELQLLANVRVRITVLDSTGASVTYSTDIQLINPE